MDSAPPAELREVRLLKKYSRERSQKGNVEKNGGQNPSLHLSIPICYILPTRSSRTDFPYTWIENLSVRARCMRTGGGSKQIVLSYARPVGRLYAAGEELK